MAAAGAGREGDTSYVKWGAKSERCLRWARQLGILWYISTNPLTNGCSSICFVKALCACQKALCEMWLTGGDGDGGLAVGLWQGTFVAIARCCSGSHASWNSFRCSSCLKTSSGSFGETSFIACTKASPPSCPMSRSCELPS